MTWLVMRGLRDIAAGGAGGASRAGGWSTV
jgi:hypothetical protein